MYSHPFESRALIPAGEIFHLPHGILHKERYGPAGVRYLVGRK